MCFRPLDCLSAHCSDLLEDLHKDGHQACIDNLLDLGVPASSDIGHCPGCLFLDIGLVVAQQVGEHRQGTCIQHTLCLLICPSYNVAKGPQGWSLGIEGE